MSRARRRRRTLEEGETVRLEVVRRRLPLAHPFVTAPGTEHERDVLYVPGVDGDGREGWGECGALSAPTYTGEWVDGAEAVLRRFLLQGTPVVGHPMASAAVEAAVLDLELAQEGTTLPEWLGATRQRVECGV